jgi:hypothetical protein
VISCFHLSSRGADCGPTQLDRQYEGSEPMPKP